MPTVRYTPGPGYTPSLAQAPQASIQAPVPAGAFDNGGSALVRAGRDLAAASDKIGQTVLAQLEEDNKIAAKDAFLGFADDGRAVDTDVRTNKKLRNAADAYAYGKSALDQKLAQRRAALQNDRQRELFDSLAVSRADHYYTAWSDYSMSEMRKADDMGSKALIDDGINFAVDNYLDPAAVAEGKNKIEIGVASLMKGADAESLRVANEAEVSRMHRGIIERLQISDAAAAMTYMKDHASEIRGQDRRDIEAGLKAEVDTQKAQLAGDEAWSRFGRNSTGAMDWFSKHYEGSVRGKAEQQYMQRLGVANAQDDRWREDTAAAVTVKILQAKTLDEANAIAAGVQSDRVKAVALKLVQERFPTEKQDTTYNPANVAVSSFLRSAIDSGAQIEIPVEGKEPITMTLDSPEKVAFASTALGLDNDNRKSVLDYYTSGGLAGKIKVSDVDHYYKAYTGKEIDKDPAMYDYVLQQTRAQLLRLGKEPTSADVDVAVKQALLTFKSEGGWFTGGGRVAPDERLGFQSDKSIGQVEVNQKYASAFGISESVLNQRIRSAGGQVNPISQDVWLRTWFIDIPRTVRERAVRELTAAGKVVDETNIRRFYLLYGGQ